MYLEESLSAYQHILLLQMLEAGDAVSRGQEVFVEADVLCRLDENARDILDLPPPWPGAMEVEARGVTDRNDFSLHLRLLAAKGMGRVSHQMDGPIIEADGRKYLPSEVQLLALQAVREHEAIAPGRRSEADNLRAVYALQQARKNGLDIDLRHFSKVSISVPEAIGVAIIDTDDGDMRLVPDFGNGMTPEAIEERLGQLAGGSSTIRVGGTIVLLNERELAATHEILSVRSISRKERKAFLRNPSAWLDAALVNLDLGFSMRMHGMEIFRKAYFGCTDASDCQWFGTGEDSSVIPLSAASALVASADDLNALRTKVDEALAAGRGYISFAEHTVVLPGSADEMKRDLDKLAATLAGTPAAEPAGTEDVPKKPEDPSVQITTAIDKHDEDEPERIASPDSMPSYAGELYRETLGYTFKQYQEEGTRWILGLMNPMSSPAGGQPYLGGLLADDMGLGKTFMVLAALNVYRRRVALTSDDKPVLAVMPVVLLENWKEEIERVFKEAPFKDIVVLQAGSDLGRFRQKGMGRECAARGEDDMPSLENMRYALKVGSDFGPDRLDVPGRLVLTNYDTLRDYQFSLSVVSWGCVIFDEAQEIRNPNALKSRAAKALNADFRLAVTGTPVENTLTDFWSLFDTVLPGVLGSFQAFNRRYNIPISKASPPDKEALKLRLGRELRHTVGPFMLRRTKEEKLDGLPAKIEHNGATDSRCRAVMSGEQLARYDSVVASVTAAKNAGEPGRLREILLPSLRRLRDVSLHPALLDGEPRRDCEDVEAELRKSAKLSLLLSILNEIRDRGEKVIIFVTNRALQRFLACALGKIYQLEIFIVNGETRSVSTHSGRGGDTRIQLIRSFEAKEGFQIICMSPLAAGVGLTVTGANNVIHLERHWNPAREAQATDRVYRIGATRDVHVYIPLLLHPGIMSFDVNLNGLLSRKVSLKDAVIANEEVHAGDFSTDALFGGGDLTSKPVGADWLDTMTWESFEALVAVMARRIFDGPAYLTPKSGDLGADVIVLCDDHGVAIQCKVSRHPFADIDAACAPRTAGTEYGKRYGRPFTHCILAVNAPSIGQNVRQRAESLHVTIWDRKYLEDELNRHPVSCAEVERCLRGERLDI